MLGTKGRRRADDGRRRQPRVRAAAATTRSTAAAATTGSAAGGATTCSPASEGDDRLRGGQDNDLLDGGDGDDYLNGGGDGRDKDRIVCGDGYDVVVLGRNDVVLVEVAASEDPAGEPALQGPEAGDDDGCEKVKGPGAPQVCASHGSGCEGAGRPCVASARECVEDDRMPCGSNDGGCEHPAEEPCVATTRGCDDPVAGEPEPDPPVEAPEPDGVE